MLLQTIMKVIALVALLVVAVAAQKKSVVDLDRNNNGIDDRREVWWPRRAGKCMATQHNSNFPYITFCVEINLELHHCSQPSQSCLLFTHGNTTPEILTIIYSQKRWVIYTSSCVHFTQSKHSCIIAGVVLCMLLAHKKSVFYLLCHCAALCYIFQ